MSDSPAEAVSPDCETPEEAIPEPWTHEEERELYDLWAGVVGPGVRGPYREVFSRMMGGLALTAKTSSDRWDREHCTTVLREVAEVLRGQA